MADLPLLRKFPLCICIRFFYVRCSRTHPQFTLATSDVLTDIATQAFLTYGKCIFDGKRTKLKQIDDIHEESTGGKHVNKARSWWKRGDVSMRGRDQHAMMGALRHAHQ
jgi:hypothetical protein